MKKTIIDVEANGLLPDLTDMWCIITTDIDETSSETVYDIFIPSVHLESYSESKLVLKPSEKVNVRSLTEFKEFSKTKEHWVGHNIINYDFRALKKLGFIDDYSIKNLTDTVILSQITQPKRQGGHSLKSWGMRFEEYKGEWKDFSTFDWGMVDYCLQDIRVTQRLYKFMENNVKNFSKFSVRLEHAVRDYLDKMEENGFSLDVERAHTLYVEIKDYCDKLEVEIQKEFPPEKAYWKKLYPRYTAKGELHGQDKKTIENSSYDKEKDEEGKEYYHLYNWQTFNPRSTTQIVERMNQLGWQPVVFNEPTEVALFFAACKFLEVNPEDVDKTKREATIKKAEKAGFDIESIKGSPKVDEENFETLPEDAPKSAKTLAEWFLYDKRLQKLNEWFRELNPKTGCIHGQVFGNGASTSRMTHRNPNMANISKVAMKKNEEGNEVLVFGKQGRYSTDMRACFRTRDIKKRNLVGIDLSGIQLRGFAHYANDKEYSEQILSGDIHTYNKDILKKLVESYCIHKKIDINTVGFLIKDPKGQRNSAKTFIYAYLFGAGNKKVGSIFEFPEALQFEAGKFIREGFVTSISGLEAFKKEIKKWRKQGFMVALDGRLISIPNEHFALSIALQSFEAIIMKYSLYLALQKIKEQNLDALLVGIIHDEAQFDVLKEHAEQVGKIVVESMEEAGKFFKSNIPITGEYNIGLNWADSH
jgi:DNA polymerase-1